MKTAAIKDQITELNAQLTDECIKWLILAGHGRVSSTDVIKYVAEIVQCTGGEIDACSRCGSMPMQVNCNNARCDT